MGFAHFIARRILLTGDGDRAERLSRPIVLIAILGIVVGMAVMIVTLGITAGFQDEVRAKVIGAGAHLQIGSIRQTDPKETVRIPIDQPFYPWLDTVPGVAHIQIHATKPGIIETGNDIQGVVVKGIDSRFDRTFLTRHLVEGTFPAIGDTADRIDMLLSRYHAKRLLIGVGDTITVYLVKDREDIRPRKFRVSGLYETGLEQLDHQLVFVDIDHLQRFSQWGLKAEIQVEDALSEGRLKFEGLAFGGDRAYTYEWPGTDLQGKGPHWISTDLIRDTTIQLVVGDRDGTIPDTAWVRISTGTTDHIAPGTSDEEGQVIGPFLVERGGSGGSHTKYCGGFEVILEDDRTMREMDELIYAKHLGFGLRSMTAEDRFPEMFAWLRLLDKNVVVVIALMIIVAMINMASALLIIILERTNMIGVLKALGSANSQIRRVFLIDAAYILGVGVILGDILGIGLCMLQQWTGIVRLPVETYYVDAVPILLDPMNIVLLDLGTLVICIAALIVPSSLVTRIAPAKAIRFD